MVARPETRPTPQGRPSSSSRARASPLCSVGAHTCAASRNERHPAGVHLGAPEVVRSCCAPRASGRRRRPRGGTPCRDESSAHALCSSVTGPRFGWYDVLLQLCERETCPAARPTFSLRLAGRERPRLARTIEPSRCAPHVLFWCLPPLLWAVMPLGSAMGLCRSGVGRNSLFLAFFSSLADVDFVLRMIFSHCPCIVSVSLCRACVSDGTAPGVCGFVHDFLDGKKRRESCLSSSRSLVFRADTRCKAL